MNCLWKEHSVTITARRILVPDETKVTMAYALGECPGIAPMTQRDLIQLRLRCQNNREKRSFILASWVYGILSRVLRAEDLSPIEELVFLFFCPRLTSLDPDLGIKESLVLGALRNADSEDGLKGLLQSLQSLNPPARLALRIKALRDVLLPLYNCRLEVRWQEMAGRPWKGLASFADLQKDFEALESIHSSLCDQILPLKALLEDEALASVPELAALRDMELPELARYVDEHADSLTTLALRLVKENLPTFDAKTVLTQLRALHPALSEHDLAVAESQVDDIASGRVAEQESELVTIILPAMTGERAFNILDDILEGGYTHRFLSELARGHYHLPESTPESAPAGTQGTLAKLSDKGPAAEADTESERDSETEPEPEDETALQDQAQAHKTHARPRAKTRKKEQRKNRHALKLARTRAQAASAQAVPEADRAAAPNMPDAPDTVETGAAPGDHVAETGSPSGEAVSPLAGQDKTDNTAPAVLATGTDSAQAGDTVPGREQDVPLPSPATGLPDEQKEDQPEEVKPEPAAEAEPAQSDRPAAVQDANEGDAPCASVPLNAETEAATATGHEASSLSEQDLFSQGLSEQGLAEQHGAEWPEQDDESNQDYVIELTELVGQAGQPDPAPAGDRDEDDRQDAGTQRPGAPSGSASSPADDEAKAAPALKTAHTSGTCLSPAGKLPDRQTMQAQQGTPASAPTSEPTSEPAWVPSWDRLHALACRLLDTGSTAALHWLMTRDFARSAIPEDAEHKLCPPWLSELVHLGLHLRPRFSEACQRCHQLLDTANAQYSNLSDEQSLLLAASLIRPVLFLPQPSLIPMLVHLGTRHRAYAPFFSALKDFAIASSPMDEQFLTMQSAEDLRRSELEQLREETLAFRLRMERSKLSFQPATVVRRNLFKKTGLFGKCLEACLQGDFGPMEECLAREWSTSERKELIEKIHAGERRDLRKIVASAQVHLLEDMDQALSLLRHWHSFASTEGTQTDAALHDALFAAIRLPDQARSCEEGLLQRTLGSLKNCRNGADYLTETVDPCLELKLWPLTLPAGEGLQDGRLVQALEELESDRLHHADALSVAVHMLHGELVLSEEYVRVYKAGSKQLARDELVQAATQANLPFELSEEAIRLDDLLIHEREVWNKRLEGEKELCLQKISDAYFRGAILSAQQALYRDSCLTSSAKSHLEQGTPAQGIRELHALQAELATHEEEQQRILIQRMEELKEAHRDKPLLQRHLRDMAERLVRTENMYSEAYAALATVEEQLASGGDLQEAAPKDTGEHPSSSALFYDLLEQDPSSLCFGDAEASQCWHNVTTSLRRNNALSSRERGFVTSLVRQLGFSLDRDEELNELNREGRPCFWRILRCRATIKSPLPHWGSRSGGLQTFVFGWDVTPERLQQKLRNSLNSGVLSAQNATTIICCNPLSAADRRKILVYCNNLNFPVLIVDTHLYTWLSCQENRIDALFGVTLAGMACNPFTPEVAGAVPPEMFFGREGVIADILDPSGPCIVYGGRQLGKTALLQQIASRRDPTLLLVHYSRPPVSQLLDSLINELHKKKLENVTRTNLEQSVREYLDTHPDKKGILVLVDECDMALEEDAKADFAQVHVLSTLMQRTNRAFKIVLTGLHSVQRFSHVSNVPLIHFGTPVCIGPLPPNDAYDLLVTPLRWLGLEFADKKLAYMAINHCNYHPKLIQMLGEELVKAVRPLRTRGETSFSITRAILFNVLNARPLQQKISECFEITLNLDECYLVIGYTMALLSLQAAEEGGAPGCGTGIQLSALQEELASYWPAAFSRRPGDFSLLESLLHEMEGLGLLVSTGGSYRLRTPNIINLLGGEETIKSKLEAYATKLYQPEIQLDEWRVDQVEALVASQYNTIAEKSNGLIYIVGSSALGLDDVPAALTSIARDQHIGRCQELTGSTVQELVSGLLNSYKRWTDGLLLWINSGKTPHVPAFMLEAARWLGSLRSERRYVRLVCLLEPQAYYDLYAKDSCHRLQQLGNVTRLLLHPWTQYSLETWYKLKGATMLPANGALLEESGGWHALLFPRLQNRPMPPVADYFARSGVCFPEQEDVYRLLGLFCDFCDETVPTLSVSDCLDELADMGQARVHQLLTMLKDLHVLVDKGSERLSLAFGIEAGLRRRQQ